MCIADERFTSTYERQAEGLAAYFHDAIVANADASSAQPSATTR
jgi:TipAS antibiotic-recognition domain